jgi:hypothetical protein
MTQISFFHMILFGIIFNHFLKKKIYFFETFLYFKSKLKEIFYFKSLIDILIDFR